MKHVTLDVLVDNTVYRAGLGAEHGLSLLLRWGEHTVLFDTGQSDLFARNARALGLDLSGIDLVVLSHGHYDHGGGLPRLLSERPELPVVAHPGAFDVRYSIKAGAEPRSIGLPAAVPDSSFRLHEGPAPIADGCTFLGSIPRVHPEGCGVRHFFLDREGRQPDPVADDSGIVLDTADGLVLITGCCHAGIANYLEVVRSRWPGRKVRMVLGGLHLGGASESERGDAIHALQAAGVETVAAMHCTGFGGARALAEATGFSTLVLETGAVLQI